MKQAATGTFEVPHWDPVSQKQVRDALRVLGSTMPDTRDAFGAKSAGSPIHHLIGTATLWGGNPDKDARYLTVSPAKNDGSTVYHLRVKDVPVDGFWSVSVDNSAGYIGASLSPSCTSARRSMDVSAGPAGTRRFVR